MLAWNLCGVFQTWICRKYHVKFQNPDLRRFQRQHELKCPSSHWDVFSQLGKVFGKDEWGCANEMKSFQGLNTPLLFPPPHVTRRVLAPNFCWSRRSIWAHDHFFCPLVRPHHSLQSNGSQSCMTTSNGHQCLLPYPSSRFSSSRLLPLSSRLLPLRH
jgi:hypothetical protein